MQRNRGEVRGILSLGTLLRLGAVSGFALGIMFGVFSGVVSFMVNGNVLDMLLIVAAAPFIVAICLVLVTMIGHPLYVVLARARFPGLDRIQFEVTSE